MTIPVLMLIIAVLILVIMWISSKYFEAADKAYRAKELLRTASAAMEPFKNDEPYLGFVINCIWESRVMQ